MFGRVVSIPLIGMVILSNKVSTSVTKILIRVPFLPFFKDWFYFTTTRFYAVTQNNKKQNSRVTVPLEQFS